VPIDLDTEPPANGVVQYLGAIVTPEQLGQVWHAFLLIVEVELVAVAKPRGADLPLAWPGGELNEPGAQMAGDLAQLADDLRAGQPIEVTRVRRDEHGKIRRHKGQARPPRE
jgi:hypothetical protein